MKKIKMFFAAAILCAAAAVGYYAYGQATMTEQERLMQANIEALMDIEYGDYSCTATVNCSNNSGSVSCTGSICERGGSIFAYTWVKCDGKKTEC